MDPEGIISVINLDFSGAGLTATVETAGFSSFNAQFAELKADGVILKGDVDAAGTVRTVAQDLEPEYIAVSGDGETAWVTLQENNAVAVVDVATATVTEILPLGTKDHSLVTNAFDASDRDDAINLQP